MSSYPFFLEFVISHVRFVSDTRVRATWQCFFVLRVLQDYEGSIWLVLYYFLFYCGIDISCPLGFSIHCCEYRPLCLVSSWYVVVSRLLVLARFEIAHVGFLLDGGFSILDSGYWMISPGEVDVWALYTYFVRVCARY